MEYNKETASRRNDYFPNKYWGEQFSGFRIISLITMATPQNEVQNIDAPDNPNLPKTGLNKRDQSLAGNKENW